MTASLNKKLVRIKTLLPQNAPPDRSIKAPQSFTSIQPIPSLSGFPPLKDSIHLSFINSHCQLSLSQCLPWYCAEHLLFIPSVQCNVFDQSLPSAYHPSSQQHVDMQLIKQKNPMMLSTRGIPPSPIILLSRSPQLWRWMLIVRYEKFFYGANDKFEVQRGLNNVFAYDLVPSVKVCEAALRACRRGNHFPHRSRILSSTWNVKFVFASRW